MEERLRELDPEPVDEREQVDELGDQVEEPLVEEQVLRWAGSADGEARRGRGGGRVPGCACAAAAKEHMKTADNSDRDRATESGVMSRQPATRRRRRATPRSRAERHYRRRPAPLQCGPQSSAAPRLPFSRPLVRRVDVSGGARRRAGLNPAFDPQFRVRAASADH